MVLLGLNRLVVYVRRLQPACRFIYDLLNFKMLFFPQRRHLHIFHVIFVTQNPPARQAAVAFLLSPPTVIAAPAHPELVRHNNLVKPHSFLTRDDVDKCYNTQW